MSIANPLLPADHAARTKALDVSGSFIVQAPAGSGKTDLLIRRVLCLLLTVEQPEQIVAITFTRKAAAEMRHRIHALLLVAANDVPVSNDYEASARKMALDVLARDKELQWGLLENPERLSLQTIDSLCAMLTRELPLTSTLGAPLSASDNAERLYLAAALRLIESSLQETGVVGDATRLLMAEFDNNLGRLQRMLAGMLSNRDQWARVMHYVNQREVLEQSLADIVEMRLQNVVELMPACVDETLVDLAARAVVILNELSPDSINIPKFAAIQNVPGASLEDMPAWEGLIQLLLTAGGTPRKRLDRNIGFPSSAKDLKQLDLEKAEAVANKEALGAIVESLVDYPEFCEALDGLRGLPATGYTDQQWLILEHLIILLASSMTSLESVFSETASCDFSEIAIRADRSLGSADEPTDLALHLDYKIQHILVDEFQDTSLSQFRLFEKLLAGWEPGDGRTFFAVGDPMQSIYRFRDAEVALFTDAREYGIGSVELEALHLSVNFRSTADIVGWCNQSFSNIFPNLDDRISGAVSFAASESFGATSASGTEAIDPDRQNPGVSWHFNHQGAHASAGSVNSQARSIAEVARGIIDIAADDDSIAILVRSRSNLLDMFQALRAASVPVRAVEMEALANRPVVADLRSLTFALLYPHDKVAWLSLLRAPWCGLTLEELHELTGFDEGRATLWETINNPEALSFLDGESRERLRKFVDVFSPAVKAAGRESLVQWVEACWLQLGGPAVCRDQSDLDAANVALKALQVLQESGELLSRKRVDEQLEALYAPSTAPSGPHVQVMTIHKSKGLEFDAVMLPFLDRRPRSDTGGLLNWFEMVENGKAHCLLAPLDTRLDKNSQDDEPITKLIRGYHKERGRNETLRLLYVAATRAKKQLHLFAMVRETDDGAADPEKASLLGALWPIASEKAADFVSASADNASEETEGDAALPEGATDTADVPLEKPATIADALSRVWRTPLDWRMPPEIKPFASSDTTSLETGGHQTPEYLWAGVDASAIGTVVHQELQLMCSPGYTNIRVENPSRFASNLKTRLLAAGVSTERLPKAVGRVERALENCLTDETGRWLLDTTHADSVAELALTAWMDGEFHSIVIDRSFVHEGTRWIIDYKTGDHRGGALDAFLDREQERYEAQLERYARILAKQHPEPLMLGLYFPLLQSFRSWQPSISVAGKA